MLSFLLSTTFSELEREKIIPKIEGYLKLDEMIKAFPFYEVIDFLYNKKSISKYNLMYNTTKSGNIRLFKQLINEGYPWDSRMLNCACYYGYLEMLDFLHQHKGAFFEFSNVLCAVKGNQIYCLHYLFSKGCSPSDLIVETAIENNCKDVLLFLLDCHQIIPSEKWMRKAIYYQKTDIFMILYEKNPIKNIELYVYAFKRRKKEINRIMKEIHLYKDEEFIIQCKRMDDKLYEEEIDKLEMSPRMKTSKSTLFKIEESIMEEEFEEVYRDKTRLSKKSIQKSKKILKEEMEKEFNGIYSEEYTLSDKSKQRSKKILESEFDMDFEEVYSCRKRLEPILEKTYSTIRCQEIENSFR